MIQTYLIGSDGTCSKTTQLPTFDETTEQGSPRFYWVDIEQPTPELIDELEQRFNLERHTIEETLRSHQRARIERADFFTQLLVHGMIATLEEAEVQPRQLSILCFDHMIITIHPEPLHAIELVSQAISKISSQVAHHGIGHILFLILDRMVDLSMILAKQYEETLEELEDRSVSYNKDEALLEDLSEVRRKIISLWRNSVAQREILIELCEEEYEFLSEDTMKRLERVRDHMTSALEITQILRLMVSEVRENYRTTLSLQSAEATKKLTVFAGLMMPLSLIAGIYGMNVPLAPDPNRSETFWGIIGVMGTIVVIQLIMFRRQRWI